MRHLVIFSALFWLLATKSFGFDLANGHKAYDEGRYEDAIQEYEGYLNTSGPDGHVLYNLGNAFARSQRLGEAVAAYLAAARILPRDPDIQANLRFVITQTKDRIAPKDGSLSWWDELLFWKTWWSYQELLWAGLVLWILGWSTILLSLSQKLKGYRFFGILLMVGGGFSSSLALVTSATDHPWAGVMVDESSILSGPGDHNQVLFKLHEGVPIRLLQETNGWALVSVYDGHETKKGWMPRTQLRVFSWSRAPFSLTTGHGFS